MSGAEPVDIYVDIAELSHIAQDLTSLTEQLNGLAHSSVLHLDPEGAGSADVAHAVDRFLKAWGDARTELAGKLEGARQYVRQAADAYDATERALSGAASPTEEKRA